MILTPQEPWYVPAFTSAIAIVSKHIFRVRETNLFNPAALALVATFYVFRAGLSWWGALPDLPPIALVALFATGLFIADRVNKIPLVLVFLGAYFLLFTAAAFLGDPTRWPISFGRPIFRRACFFRSSF